MRRIVFWVVVGALLAATGTWRPVWGAGTAESWGVVDMQQIAVEYRGMHDLEQQFQEFQGEQDELLEKRYKTRVLYDDERQEFFDLADMGAPTEDRDKRLAELADMSDSRERRLLELRQSKERTPAEEEEYKQLTALYDERMAEMAALQADMQQARRVKQETLNRVLTESVNGAVKAVAEEKGLAIVLRKEIVMYGGPDITTEVLAKLNAAEPVEAAAEATPEATAEAVAE